MVGPVRNPNEDAARGEHRVELRYPDRVQIECFGGRLIGLFNYFEAGLSTSLVIRATGGDPKLIGWIVHGSDDNRCEAQAHRGPPGAGAWIWRPKSGMRRRRV